MEPAEQYHPTPGPAAAEPSVLGLDNVPLDLQPAGLGTRSLAMLVDGVVLMVISVVWGLLVVTLAGFSGLSTAWIWALGGFGYFLIQWGYFSVCEILLDGKTPGKMSVSLQTVSHLGGQPSVGAVIIRNLLRPIDYFFGVFFMALDPLSRRLGDRVASTMVVHRGNLESVESFSARTGPGPMGCARGHLGGKFPAPGRAHGAGNRPALVPAALPVDRADRPRVFSSVPPPAGAGSDRRLGPPGLAPPLHPLSGRNRRRNRGLRP